MRLLLQRMAMPPRMFSWAVSSTLLCALFGVVALTVLQVDRSSQQNIKEQFRIRADLGATFLHAYVQELLARERSIAELQLSATQISDAALSEVVKAFSFETAIVMDASGTALQAYPAAPDLTGTHIAPRYAHLQAALASGSAASGVVPSAAAHAPVVAFATRYETATGPRLFSGAFDVRTTPLNAYMKNVLEISGANADLLDASGLIVASNRSLAPRVSALDSVDPLLAKARRENTNEYETEHGSKLFFERKVTGTPWSLVISAEQSRLLALVHGSRGWVLWALFGAFCAASIVAAYLLLRLRAMSKLNAHLARFDRLTDLPNRLHLEEHLTRLVSDATRHNRPLSILIVDIDHFKRVNDCHGHRVGDEVLRALAARMTKALRTEDMLGRWGGEEFLALLPNTSAEGAYAVASRVRAMASSSPIVTHNGIELHITVSIGCATRESPTDVDYIQRADEALYSAKSLGRDRVVSSAPPSPRRDGEAQTLAHGA